MIKLIQLSFDDESVFPPQCCHTEIPQTLLQPIIDPVPDLKQKSEDKLTYHNDSFRTHCSNSTCARYLGPNTESPGTNIRYCVSCLRWTCMTCQKTHFPWLGCQFDDEDALQWMKKLKLQQCCQCEYWVELEAGCNHIV